MEFGILTKPSVWLYGADRKKAIDELLMGWAVKILGKEGEWCRVVTHYGYEGFLKEGDLCACTEDGLRKRDVCGNVVFVGRAFADILAEPKVQGRILCTLSRGSFLSVLPEEKAGYQKVALFDGREGYLPQVAYEKRRDNDGYFYSKDPGRYFMRQIQCGGWQEIPFRKQLLVYAARYLGTQYRWAGKSAEGLDCSGLTLMCYMMCGVLIYRDAQLMAGYPVHSIPVEQVRPGDLLYFPGHIAMYAGSHKYIHATGNENSFGCVVNSLSHKDPDYREDLAKGLVAAGSVW
jgi:hypothetical protein